MQQRKSVNISIIVPVYNVAPYLPRCLDSLVGQTLRDIEIICIDDKSTDDSLKICREYAKKDKRVKVIALKKNSGVAAARNTGIDASTGKYLGFVDSDDYVDSDFYEKLYSRAIENNSDIVVSNIRETALDGTVCVFDGWLKRIAQNRLNFDYTLWCAIYRTDFIKNNKIYNPVGIMTGQDAVFVIHCAVMANSIATVPDAYYNYIRREGSLWQNIQPPVKIKSRIAAIQMICDMLNRANLPDDDYAWMYAKWMMYLQGYVARNTSQTCHQMIADAMIDLYKSCKDKNGFVREYAKYDVVVRDAGRYLMSEDSEGLVKYLVNPPVVKIPTPIVPKKYKHTVYLFSVLPLVRIDRTPNHTIVRVFGLKLYERKQTASNLRVLVMYIPIIRIKSK